MLVLARAFALTLILSACSLRSTSDLTRCESKPDASGCATAGAAGSAAGGSGASGGASAAGASAGTAGNAGESGCSENVDCDPNEICGANGTCEPGLLVLYAHAVKDGDTDVPEASTYLRPWFEIDNLLEESVPLEQLTLRYYYTIEDAAAEGWDCFLYDGADSCADLEVTFAGTEMEHYFEIGFTAGELPFGGDSGEIKIGVYKDGFSKYKQTDDYSYTSCDVTALGPCDAVTLYRNDQLVWGTPPY